MLYEGHAPASCQSEKAPMPISDMKALHELGRASRVMQKTFRPVTFDTLPPSAPCNYILLNYCRRSRWRPRPSTSRSLVELRT